MELILYHKYTERFADEKVKRVPSFYGYFVTQYGAMFSAFGAGNSTGITHNPSKLVELSPQVTKIGYVQYRIAQRSEQEYHKPQNGYFLGPTRNDLTYNPKPSRKVLFAHRAVLLAFLGPPPIEGYEADHIDGNKQNNHISNLEWVSKSENHKRRWRREKGPGWKNKNWSNKTGRTRLTMQDAKDIRASKLSPKELATVYQKHIHTIRRILWNKVLTE